MRIAIIGAGIAGNVAAWHLSREHEVTVYEAAGHIGGHTHTHEVALGGRTYHVDSGFIVFNDRTYPNFVRLLDRLGVASQPSTMSFSVRDERCGLEYSGASVRALFAQRRNLVRPGFWRMLRDVLRFNREAPALLAQPGGDLALGEYLGSRGYSREFVEHYIVPMGAAIWSTDPQRMLGFPARFFVRFFHHHGMLELRDRPRWRVISGGSARYVERLVARFRDRIRLRTPVEWVRRMPAQVLVKARGQPAERYDAAFLACHSDQALALLADPSPAEREVLGAIAYQKNEAVLHTDARLLPTRRLAWAAWNYHVLPEPRGRVAITYNLSILQSLEAPVPFLVTLNRPDAVDPAKVIAHLVYEHPLYTPAAVAAQARQREINGARNTYFCGAYWRYGFHEDGVVSALEALEHFRERTDAQRALSRTA